MRELFCEIIHFGCYKPGGRPLSKESAAKLQKEEPGSICEVQSKTTGESLFYKRPEYAKKKESQKETEKQAEKLAKLEAKPPKRGFGAKTAIPMAKAKLNSLFQKLKENEELFQKSLQVLGVPDKILLDDEEKKNLVEKQKNLVERQQELEAQNPFIKTKREAKKAGLKDFQAEGVHFLETHDHAFLGDDMGTGKTAQIIFSLRKGENPVLVVCPSSLKYNWETEFKKWLPMDGYPYTSIKVANSKDEVVSPKKGEVLICNYDILPEDLSSWSKDFTVVFDEAHYIKNPSSARSVRAKNISGLAKKVIGASATPINSSPLDIWGIFKNLGMAKNVWASFDDFKSDFSGQGNEESFIWGNPKQGVRKKLDRFGFLRRTQKEVLDQRPKVVHEDIQIDAPQTDNFSEFEKEIAEAKSIEEVHNFPKTRAFLNSLKIPAAMQAAKSYEEAGEPAVFFSTSRGPIDTIGQRPGWKKITGDETAKEKNQIVRDFQSGFLKGVAITIAAGGVGLTLTRAKNAVFLDEDYNPSANEQAIARINRIGQMADVITVKHLRSNHPLEKRISQIISTKEKFISPVMERPIYAQRQWEFPEKGGEKQQEFFPKKETPEIALKKLQRKRERVMPKKSPTPQKTKKGNQLTFFPSPKPGKQKELFPEQ